MISPFSDGELSPLSEISPLSGDWFLSGFVLFGDLDLGSSSGDLGSGVFGLDVELLTGSGSGVFGLDLELLARSV